MVSAANALAAEAGREMLRAGGSAIDAAIATQLVLNLVEPQSSGLGGGAFILYWDKASAELKVYDGRETAPASARPDRFLVNGKPMPFDEAVLSGLSIGVPGLVRLLEDVHKRHGKLPWAKLFEPAIRIAEQGFDISQRLHILLRLEGAESFVPAARRYFFTQTGNALPIGHLLKNPEFAATLRSIAAGGSAAFYEGPIAQAIVDAVAAAPIAPGGMTLDDLKGYTVRGACAAVRHLSRARGLRRRPAVLGRPYGGADAEAARAVRPRQRPRCGAAMPRPCISSLKPRSSPMPTATATSAIRILSPSRTVCSMTRISRSVVR